MLKRPVRASALRQRHSSLCLRRAFSRDKEEREAANDELSEFDNALQRLKRAERDELGDSGIAGTQIHYSFSFDVARWLARKAPAAVAIDWADVQDCEQLDELLRHLLLPSEDEYFDSGYASTREWLDIARASHEGTDFDWLMAQLEVAKPRAMWRQLYDAADIPLVWDLADSRFSKSRNVFPARSSSARRCELRSRPANVKQEIQRPLSSVARQTKSRGTALIDVAMASLATRHRETYHFNFANPDDVYLADVGEGIGVVVFGLRPEYRFPLECTMGYLILSNGVPIGYGGASALFKQVNTGINIFDEYRGSEASFLWVQVMRVYHALTACTRFIANAYQLGDDNSEALKSGAFWFYYRLGYRPVLASVRRLAGAEMNRRQRNPNYRSSNKVLRALASCDMHLVLPGAKQSDLFDEEWLATSSMLATRIIGQAGGRTRSESANAVMQRVARDLGFRSLQSWSTRERAALAGLAPFLAAAKPATWSTTDKRLTRKAVRAKGGDAEALYARLVGQDDQFLQSLRKACHHE
ncbi:MAG: hypothetical protein OEM25_01370 [Gammaproteobacteria bacterium]|nr:hypothetical protein [Gammaproteobacteria bacterium]